MTSRWTIGQLLAWATAVLEEHAVPSPRWDAEVLLASVVGRQPLMLPLFADEAVPAAAAGRYQAMVGRRAAREPLQYILGEQEFMGLRFAVDQRVLVPRPETEHLVEAAITHLDALDRDPAARGLSAAPLAADIGTGSGAIAVSLATRIAHLHVFAIDISLDAIAVASENAQRQGVTDRITFLQGDLFAPLPPDLHGQLALVASNPPYIASGELPQLQAEVRREPRLALDGGYDGLDLYRRIIAEALHWLRAGGLLALEIGDRQGKAVAKLVADAGAYSECTTLTDYAGHDRVVLAKR
ncbi:MAG: peptide chain release factor N(5)-glutamine methyltransferase [Chloroflexota bacterium]